ncbi:MAG: hypothetical protein K2J73_02650 [Oscillospiraceae bacterium]|nr:hypothetical protein [Oscillospiraceae bacterium]
MNTYNVLDFIPVGQKNALPMSELAKRIGISQREARKAIFNARCKGEIICSTCGENTSGYYRPASVSEALPYIKLQESRIASSKAALKSTKRFVEAGGGNA